jgi:hypothetical protein
MHFVFLFFFFLSPLLGISLNTSSSPTSPIFHLSLSIPKSPNVFTSYLTVVDITLHLPSSSSMNQLFSNYQLCLIFSDHRDYCHGISRLYQPYKISFSHETNVPSTVDFYLCPVKAENSELCRSSSISSIHFIAKPPHLEITRELWSFLVPSKESYLNHRIGIIIGSLPSHHLTHFIGISDDLRIMTSSPFASSPSLDSCRNEILGRIVECCDLQRTIHQCLPPVADVGVIILNKEFITNSWNIQMINKFISALSLINGRALILSPDLSFFEILELLPSDFLEMMTFQSLPTDPISLRKYYPTILLVDVSSLWIRHKPTLRSLQSIPPSLMSTSFSYGYDTVTLQNVCLMNQTSIIYFSSSPSHSSSEPDQISPDFLKFLKKKYPNWRFHQNNYDVSSFVSFVSKTALVAVPPYTYSIYHLIQTLLSIFHYLHQHSSPSSAWLHKLQDHFFFLFPTMTRDDYQWSFQFISLIKNFMIQHLQNLTSSTLDGPQIFFHEDLQDLTRGSSSRRQTYRYLHTADSLHFSTNVTPENILPNILCFEQLIVLSPTHISTPFINDNVEANAVRRYIYDWIDDTIFPNGSYFDPAVYHRTEDPLPIPGQHPHQPEEELTHPSLSPNHPLRVTLISRPHNRRILNLDELIRVISTSGLVDMTWFMKSGGGSTHGIYLESFSFRDQVYLMKETDLLIHTHGSVMSNYIFLKEYSAVIEIMTSPWYQMATATAISMNIYFFSLIQTKKSFFSSFISWDEDEDDAAKGGGEGSEMRQRCEFDEQCLKTSLSILHRGLCYSLRQCDTWVDLERFEVLLHHASHHVRFMKRKIHVFRDSLDETVRVIESSDSEEIIQWKMKFNSYQAAFRESLDEEVRRVPYSVPPQLKKKTKKGIARSEEL